MLHQPKINGEIRVNHLRSFKNTKGIHLVYKECLIVLGKRAEEKQSAKLVDGDVKDE